MSWATKQNYRKTPTAHEIAHAHQTYITPSGILPFPAISSQPKQAYNTPSSTNIPSNSPAGQDNRIRHAYYNLLYQTHETRSDALRVGSLAHRKNPQIMDIRV
ncbi:uncharacterized protein STEHIDRAFT_160808 [Stereum hirsutum FP-91666 SS1]|uniref:uncharacterized protein n=1 Tax=Stereum hirsutum (strain FP-91666) TaxID=721885 RepID=UPI000444A8BB|nr:uncharacterized protein STEHIDRAFT_160808 [Stereum hirsutum FP-91666 SS1]EIM82253.1 hypothetical protein STEHIDRAFT_160808 [Stereum hirsutum FP-91666 SS1]